MVLLLKATLTSVLPQRKKAGYTQVLQFIYYRLPSQTSPSPPKPFILFQKEISAALGRAVPQALSDIFSCTTGISTPTCPRRQSHPQPPFLRPGRVPRVRRLQGTWLGSAGRNSWSQCKTEIPLLSIQHPCTHTPAHVPDTPRGPTLLSCCTQNGTFTQTSFAEEDNSHKQ